MLRSRSSSVKWHSLVIAAVLLLSYAYFPDLAGGWNQDSRFGLTRALSEAQIITTATTETPR